MTNTESHEYTVCFMFDGDLKNVLLVQKRRTEYAGRLNGVGGELEPGESARDCAAREILEETGIGEDGMRAIGTDRLVHLGTLSLPYDCKYKSGKCVLHYYAGVAEPGTWIREETDRSEKLAWEPVLDVLASNVKSRRYAGDGDLPYFVNMARERLRAIAGEGA